MKLMCASVLLATLALSACAPEQVTVSQPLDTQERVSSPGVDALPPKPATPLPRLEVLSPDASAIAAHHVIDMPAALPVPQQERIQSAPVPVLVPDVMTAPQLAAALVTTGEHWAAISSTHDGVTLYIQATRASVEHPQIELDEAGDELTKQPYVLSRTHQIITIAFTRFGLGYSLEVECAAPQSDPRCTRDDYALALYDSLALVARPEGGAQ